MYKAQCKDVFNGGRDKTVESLKEYKFNLELQEFWESAVNFGADMAWMLVALAQYSEGKDSLKPILQEKWTTIKAESAQYDNAAERIAVKHTHYFLNQDTTLMGTKHFINRCMDYLDDKNSIWQAYGFMPYLSALALVSMEYGIWLYMDADGNFEQVAPDYPDMIEAMNLSTGEQYERLMDLRLKVAQRMEVVLNPEDVTITELLKRDTNLKEYRNKLNHLINLDILRSENRGRMSDILQLLNSGAIQIIDVRNDGRVSRKGGSELPDDIKGMKFND